MVSPNFFKPKKNEGTLVMQGLQNSDFQEKVITQLGDTD